MKQFKQLASLFLAFALVVGLFSAPTVAYAEDTKAYEGRVEVDYTSENLIVTKTANQKVYYTTKWTETSHAKTVWDEIIDSSTSVIIDFSWTSPSKDVTFYITDDPANKPISVEIKAQEKNLAVMFSGVANTTTSSKLKLAHDWSALNQSMGIDPSTWSYGFLCAAVKNGQTYVALTTGQAMNYLQFRKGLSGDWQPIQDLDVSQFATNGAQLYFRLGPTNNKVASGSSIALGRASKEVKVSFGKQANAPKVTINGDTKEIKLGKTMEYRVGTITSGGALDFGTNKWVAVSDNHMDGTKVKTTYLKDLLTKPVSGSTWNYSEDKAGQVVQVRVAATEKAIASKIRTIELNKVTAPIVSTSSGIEFALVKSTTYADGIKVTNNCTAGAIQVAVVSGSPADVNAKSIKWTTIAAKKDQTKSVVLKGTALAAGDRIIYRFASVKDDTKTPANEFMVSSNYVEYLKSNLPLAEQSITVTGLTKVTAPDTVTATSSAIAAGQALIKVTNSSTAAALAYTVNVAGTNISSSATVTVECVNGMTDSATKVAASTVKLAADGKIGETGKLKLTLTDAAAAGDTFFRVKVDGYKFYIKVTFAK